jgi:hypothetical protein
MANIYSGMTSAQKDNERKYLNNLVSGGGGNAEWAKGQLKQLDSSGSSTSTPKTTSTSNSGSSGSSSKKSSSSSSNKYYTTVTESNGSKTDGYIQDGVSYYNNGTPINIGASVVDSTGKTWVKGGDPDAGLTMDEYFAKYGVSGASSNSYKPNYGDMGDELSYNPYEEAYRESQRRLEEMEAQIREQNRLAVEQGTNRLNAQKSNINQAADENARQAYIQYMQSQKALPQQLASQGVSGGATETANLGLQTAYQNNVNAINQNKANRLQEIDNAIVDLQNTGDLSTVEQVLANNQAALDAYMNTFDKGVGYNQWANQFNANRQDTLADQAYRDKVYADQMTQQQWENDWFEKQYNDEKKQAELDRTLQGYYNGYYDAGYTSAQTGIPIEYLYDTKSERELMAKLERANTQSLISNRNYQTQKEAKEQAEEESNNKYYNLATKINNQYANNTTGKNAGDAVIMDDGNGGYTLNPNISRGSYLDLVIARAFDSDMSDNEVKTFLNNLGISDSDISRVAAYYLK